MKRDLWEAVWAAERENPTTRIRVPIDVLGALGDRRIKYQTEGFYTITLNGNHEIIHVRTVVRGLVNRTLVHPREVFRQAIGDNAVAIIVAHNHPSGSVDPSEEDNVVTKRLVDAGAVVGIPVLDHVVVSRKGYYSYLEHDLI